MAIRPGITIQYSRDIVREGALVRSDIAGFIGIVPKAAWPKGLSAGDFIELPLNNYGTLAQSPIGRIIDPATKRAVQSFFDNGGEECRVFGLCIEDKTDLMSHDPFEGVFIALLDRLRGQEDIGILAMPVLAYLPIHIDRRGWPTVPAEHTIAVLLKHCREMNNRFLILDTPRDLHERALTRWVSQFRRNHSEEAAYGALYYPWLQNGDEVFPPSGSVAGLFARVDLEHRPVGVHWPPANQPLRGVTHPQHELSWKDSGTLNEAHINPILVQPARGVVVWGARTLSRDAKWRHVNSRRVVSYICEQLRRDAEWVVFENQRPELWQIIQRMVRARLDMLWSAGMLTGDQPGDEYFVQCDEELNPPELRDVGQVNVKVMVRPIATAEYIVVDLKLGA